MAKHEYCSLNALEACRSKAAANTMQSLYIHYMISQKGLLFNRRHIIGLLLSDFGKNGSEYQMPVVQSSISKLLILDNSEI